MLARLRDVPRPNPASGAPRGRTLILVSLLLCLAAALAASPADAARKHLPASFFGMSLNPSITDPGAVSDTTLDQQVGLMDTAGVSSLRLNFPWVQINPLQGVYNWSYSDRLVRAAARNHVKLMPTVMFTPRWASSNPGSIFFTNFAPRSPRLYGAFMTKLVKRYGPRGAFWRQNRDLPKVPVRTWQIWNEPMQCFFWFNTPWPRTYVPLLKAADKAVHKADKRAVVVTAGLSGGPNRCSNGRSAGGGTHPSWDDLRQIYRHGGKNAFDAVAINQYTNAEGGKFSTGRATGVKGSVDHLFQVAESNQRVSRRFHDRGVELYLTEFGWPAAVGHLPRNAYRGLESTPKGSAKRMKAFFAKLNRNGSFKFFVKGKGYRRFRPKSLHIAKAFYFTWASGYERDPRQNSFAYSGLNRWTEGSGFRPTPLARAFRKAVHRYRR